MRINSNEMRVFFDVDGTLVEIQPDMRIDEAVDKKFLFNYYGETVICFHIDSHIALLKSYKKRGYEVVVWSANGVQWAYEVVTKLGLEKFVDEVATKPLKYVDDKSADSWMQRVFIGDDKC